MFIALTTLFFATLATAVPQAGGGSGYAAAGNKYSGGGCNPNNLIFGDPIYVSNNCTPLDRFGGGAAIGSYQTGFVSPGCTGTLNTIHGEGQDMLTVL
jgi:hypothetical protein